MLFLMASLANSVYILVFFVTPFDTNGVEFIVRTYKRLIFIL